MGALAKCVPARIEEGWAKNRDATRENDGSVDDDDDSGA